MSKIFPPKRIQNVGPAAKDAVSYLLCRIEKRMEGEPAKKKKKKNQRCQSQGTTFHEFPRKLIHDCHLGVSQCNMVSVNLFYPIGWGLKTPLY